jgi:hypothetical protein
MENVRSMAISLSRFADFMWGERAYSDANSQQQALDVAASKQSVARRT